jgi:hypothetical protein
MHRPPEGPSTRRGACAGAPAGPLAARRIHAHRVPVRRLAAAALAAAAPIAFAQTPAQQVVRGPVATYWLTADTVSGLGAMGAGGAGAGALLGMLSGRAGADGPSRTLDLRLGSSQAASGAPQAAHLIPPGMAMGAQLPLVTPEAARPEPPGRDRQLPEGVEQPRGRMLIFWGCGETVGPGQPVIIDFSKVAAGQPVPNLVSRSVRAPRGPAAGTSRTYGHWPNERDRQSVPGQASLRGEHQVKGNYSPDIRFAIERHDFMPGVELASARAGGGGQAMSWKPVAGATGYFMAAFGGTQDGAGGGVDMVMWTSSAVQETGGALTDHVPPAEVARLIRERVVLPPDRTECTVPAEVTKAMPMGMLSFVAYGDELNLAHPPRPQDPRVPWDMQWAVKLRLKSTTMVPLGEGMAGLAGARGPRGGSDASAPASAPAPAADGQSAPPAEAGAQPAPSPAAGGIPGLPGLPGAGEAVDQGVRVLRGIFGR